MIYSNTTNQELFTIMADHMIEQGKKSVNSSGQCCYRHYIDYSKKDALMCPVGKLIPNEFYDEIIEGKKINSKVMTSLLLSIGIYDTNAISILSQVQSVHDGIGFDLWPFYLSRIAEKFGLEYKAPTDWRYSLEDNKWKDFGVK